MAKPRSYRIHLVGVGIGLGITALILAFALVIPNDTYQIFELATLDFRFKYRPTLPTGGRLLHIDIDDYSIDKLGRFPWPREIHAEVIQVLADLGAENIVLDVEMPDPSQPIIDKSELENTVKGGVSNRFQSLAAALQDFEKQLVQEKQDHLDLAQMNELFGALRLTYQAYDQDICAQIDSAVRDPDLMLASAIEASGRTYLPMHLKEKKPEPRPAETEAELEDYLRQNFQAAPAKIRENLGLLPIDVDRMRVRLKEKIARELAENLVQASPLPSALTLYQELLGTETPLDSADKKLIDQALEKAQSIKFILDNFSLPVPEAGVELLHQAADMTPPRFIFARPAAGIGFVNSVLDPDGKLRTVPLVWRYRQRFGSQVRDRLLLHLVLVHMLEYFQVGYGDLTVKPGKYILLKGAHLEEGSPARDLYIPINEKGEVMVNWAGNFKAGYLETFGHLPFAKVAELAIVRREMEQLYTALDKYRGGRFSQMLRDKRALVASPPGPEREQALVALEAQMTELRAETIEHLKHFISRTEEQLAEEADPETKKELSASLKLLENDYQLSTALMERETRLKRSLAIVENSICIIGATFTAGTDIRSIPIQKQFPGVGLYSSAANMLVSGKFIHAAHPLVNFLSILFCGLVISSFIARYRPAPGALVALFLAAAYTGFAYYLFVRWGYQIQIAGGLLALFFCYSGITAYRQLTEEREKRRTRRAFQYYLHPDVVNEVLENPEGLGIKGESKELTVFFSDVAGFTTISEGMSPEDLCSLLNEYLSEMTDIILAQRGCLDKYEGDLIMAFFGAPIDLPDHATRACMAALENQKRLAELRDQFIREGRPPIRVRIGLNTGEMRVGNMGSRTLFDYTVMGDSVNLGSRLEEANKNFGTYIMISERTYTLAKDAVEARELGLITVKGKAEPVRVYVLVARKGEMPREVADILPVYQKGLHAFQTQRWDEAIEAFREVLDLNPTDGPSRVYLDRTFHLKTEPPPFGWPGVFTTTE